MLKDHRHSGPARGDNNTERNADKGDRIADKDGRVKSDTGNGNIDGKADDGCATRSDADTAPRAADAGDGDGTPTQRVAQAMRGCCGEHRAWFC